MYRLPASPVLSWKSYPILKLHLMSFSTLNNFIFLRTQKMLHWRFFQSRCSISVYKIHPLHVFASLNKYSIPYFPIFVNTIF